jgi:TnpA family transposase
VVFQAPAIGIHQASLGTGPKADFEDRCPRVGPLLTRRLNTELITGMWDDLLRVAASVEGGHATAATVVGRLCSSKRQQNALTSAIKEYGALRRTLYAAGITISSPSRYGA